ncbi:MAG: phosphoenolpyruvate carboxykinase (GTP) [Deltaproteobacteria bacterium]|nr:phosphoenolpyruvate carboxykinase (GTP) [Deltaproteobacteria bacterium]
MGKRKNTQIQDILKGQLGDQYQKLASIANPQLHAFIAEYVELCKPTKVFVCTDSAEDIRYTREAAIRNHEEAALAIKGHTIHFDGYYDQARDKATSKFLLPTGVDLGPEINAMDREEGIREIHKILKNSMEGKELYIKFFCLGPPNSEFAVPCVQLTDSSYVAHSEDLLYRQGYSELRRLGDYERFFKFVHSQGELEKAGLGLLVSKNIEKRRVYIDLEDEIIYSTNTQYGGNTLGLKKLAMRLAIKRGSQEGWLTEHMLLMGVHGQGERVTYFAGAFPSMCGKTSTATIPDETIVGDDIAYLRNINGHVRAVNVEKGMFGIIEGVNAGDDPILWKALNSPGEIIFSNILVTNDRTAYWVGKDGEVPQKGTNHAGEWFVGKKDKEGKDIPPSHKNARFTLDLALLTNVGPELHDPQGVPLSGIIYGGRDSDTWVPVEEAFDWTHGIITKGAVLESETTAATLGKEGVRVFNPMSNLDFLSIPIGRYIADNLTFGANVTAPPRIFSVNYFLRTPDGQFANQKTDKRVWLKWMELRVHGDADAITTPTGFIPLYEDLKRLFQEILTKDYPEGDYLHQFSVRVPHHLAKIDRLTEIYRTRVTDTPQQLFEVLEQQRERLQAAQAQFGDHISPDKF